MQELLWRCQLSDHERQQIRLQADNLMVAESAVLAGSSAFQGFCVQLHRFVADPSAEASLRASIPGVIQVTQELQLPPERMLRAFRNAQCFVQTPAPDDSYSPRSKRYSQAVAWLLTAYFAHPKSRA